MLRNSNVPRTGGGRTLVSLIALCSILLAGATCGAVEIGGRDEAQVLQNRIEELLLRYTDKHPDVIAARKQLAAIREREAREPTRAVVPATQAAAAAPGADATTAEVEDVVDQGETRANRPVRHEDDFAALCRTPGVVGCFDFEGDMPLASRAGGLRGELLRSGDGATRAALYGGAGTLGRRSVRMDFRAEDGSDHGAFVFTADEFKEGDRMIVQWRQWFSPELVTTFNDDLRRQQPTVGGDGAKQLVIGEIGPSEGCSFGEIVGSNYYWSGILTLYHGCGLWFMPKVAAPVGGRDPSDFDLQPGGDNMCRYRYIWHPYDRRVGYLYPTEPKDVRQVPEFSAGTRPSLLYGCMGWHPREWMTFRLEVDIHFCKDSTTGELPPSCLKGGGRVRYWLKYADEDKPWLFIDYPMSLRWQPQHSGRYGRFMFTPYNTNEAPRKDKPPAYTMYDDILVAKNVRDLPWPTH